MGNKILNASGLDGSTSWSGVSSTDDSVVGAEGRIVLIGGTIRSSATAVTAGKTIEAAGLSSGLVSVEFLDSIGTVGATVALPRKSAARGEARRAIASSFNVYRGRLVVPPGATQARLKATTNLLRPWLETLVYDRFETSWNVGPHANVDLNLASWPTKLPPFQEDSFSAEPIATRGSFAGDSGIPITRRKFTTPRYMVKGALRLDSEEQDRLDDFFRQAESPFWFVRQDNMQLCRAYWTADGEPSYSGLVRGRRRVSLTLLLEVS